MPCAGAQLTESKQYGGATPLVRIPRGSLVTLQLSLPPGFLLGPEHASKTLRWEGDITHVHFPVSVSADCAPGDHACSAFVYRHGVRIALLRFLLTTTPQPLPALASLTAAAPLPGCLPPLLPLLPSCQAGLSWSLPAPRSLGPPPARAELPLPLPLPLPLVRTTTVVPIRNMVANFADNCADQGRVTRTKRKLARARNAPKVTHACAGCPAWAVSSFVIV